MWKNAIVVRNEVLLCSAIDPGPWPLNPKTVPLLGYPKVIPYTKFKHFGNIRFWVMLRTNRQTDKQTDSKILPTPTDIVGVGKYFDRSGIKPRIRRVRAVQVDNVYWHKPIPSRWPSIVLQEDGDWQRRGLAATPRRPSYLVLQRWQHSPWSMRRKLESRPRSFHAANRSLPAVDAKKNTKTREPTAWKSWFPRELHASTANHQGFHQADYRQKSHQ